MATVDIVVCLQALPTQGTVATFEGFDPEVDCKKLHRAMKGLGTDEMAIILIICHRSNAQRQELKMMFKRMYGKDLVDELKSELSGDFGNLIVALMTPFSEYDATCIRNAVKGLGTNEATLIEVLTSRSNKEMQEMKVAYNKVFGKEMEKAVASDLSGDFKRILVSLICGSRDPDGPVNTAKASTDAQDIYNAGEGQKLGTDEAQFNLVFACRSYSHLRVMYAEYQKSSQYSIEGVIKKEMSGDVRDAFLAIVEVSKDSIGYLASRLYKSMKGVGTDEATLTRVMVSRSEKDLVQIKQSFLTKYGKTLYSFIKANTSGYYEKALLALCRD